jgi:hypothetical protein
LEGSDPAWIRTIGNRGLLECLPGRREHVDRKLDQRAVDTKMGTLDVENLLPVDEAIAPFKSIETAEILG